MNKREEDCVIFSEYKKNVLYPIVRFFESHGVIFSGSQKIPDAPFNRIFNEFHEYKKKVHRDLKNNRLDRHKLAACMCFAIMNARPLKLKETSSDVPKLEYPNEIYAMLAGLHLMKNFVVEDFIRKYNIPVSIRPEIRKGFKMGFPPKEDNITDKELYSMNLMHALRRRYSDTKICGCDKYDVWAYAKIYYHLDLYNAKRLEKIYSHYIKK